MLVKSKARLRHVSIPPRKMRLVASQVKGMPVQKALDVLNFTPKIAARHVAKTVSSAAANALSQEGTDRLRPEDLFIKDITVDAAPSARRIRFYSMGRAHHYKKRYCHLTVILEGRLEEEVMPKKTKAKPKAKTTTKKSTAAAKKTTAKAAKDKSKTAAKPKAKTATKAAAKPKAKKAEVKKDDE